MLTTKYPTANAALPQLIGSVLKYGTVVPSRNGETTELGPVQLELTTPGNGYITSQARKASVVAQIAETMWVLAGRNDVDWLSRYLPRAPEFSDDGKVWRGGYGPRIRKWDTRTVADLRLCEEVPSTKVDQLAHVVQLLTADPNTRRAVINIYDPAVDTEPGKDIPCNNWLHFMARDGVLDLHIATRSNDLIWGWSGINAFEWNALLRVVAGLTGLGAGKLTFSISSLHIYAHHYDRARQIMNAAGGTPVYRPAPEMNLPVAGVKDVADLDRLLDRWFELEQRIREATDATPQPAAHMGTMLLDNLQRDIASFPEDMMRSWLRVLLAWNMGGTDLPNFYDGTDLHIALVNTPARKFPQPEPSAFLQFVQQLHAEKDAVYGDSWCRRGEQMAIMANIARKVDRLGVAGAGDTASDTAIDMAVYLVKYFIWHKSNKQGRMEVLPYTGPEHVAIVNRMLEQLDAQAEPSMPTEDLEAWVVRDFDRLEQLVKANTSRGAAIQALSQRTWQLARRLWQQEQEHEQDARQLAQRVWQQEQDAADKKQQWKDGNQGRLFDGYNTTEDEA